MIFSQEFFMSFLLWISLTLYLVALFPQIRLNKRLKSVTGLSDLYLYAFFLAYVTETFYVICLGFHAAYTWLVPCAGICAIIMVIQRFYYHTIQSSRKLFALYALTAVCGLALIPVAYFYSAIVGNAMGWVATCLWSTYQIPQIVKNISRKSVKGFSLGLTLTFGCAALCECAGAFVLGLPLQTMINGIRSLCMFSIFCSQFLYYGRK